MNFFEWLSIALFGGELGLLIFICWEGWETLKVERKNLFLYEQYFNERVRWRTEKRQQRATKVVVNLKMEPISATQSLGIIPCNISDGRDFASDVPDATKA